VENYIEPLVYEDKSLRCYDKITTEKRIWGAFDWRVFWVPSALDVHLWSWNMALSR